MNEERDQRLYDLFQRACKLSSEEQETLLEAECADDAALKQELRQLLAMDKAEALGSFAIASKGPGDVIASPLNSPEQIGQYRILRELGRGGMGLVYLAEQDKPRRLVAIKLLGALTDRLRARFELEADVLARLQHPSIAQIYESGTAEVGGAAQPYFAMEYVEGETLLEYAEAHTLSDAQRLSLLIDLCEAVHHAHQKGVIHRDLKPANILVNANGQLKVLDFGIARLTDADINTTTLRTNVGELVGTIPYMSPEQAHGDSAQLDTRSDVYALGIVGYQLLSGRLPYDVGQRLVHEALRIVQDEAPAPLSSVSPRLRGDVETIIGKALQKDPAMRYQSAMAMEEDIRRFLNDEPIMARPPSVAYQLRKFARRNSLLVGSAAAILVLLVAGLISTTTLAWKVRQQRDRALVLQQEALQAQQRAEAARTEAEQARQRAEMARNKAERSAEIQGLFRGFLQDVFTMGSPDGGDKEMTVAEALDLAADRVQQQLGSDPQVEASVRMLLAQTYKSFGKAQQTIEQIETAIELAKEVEPPIPGDIAYAHSRLGTAYLLVGRIEEAEQQFQRARKLLELPELKGHYAQRSIELAHGGFLLDQNRLAEAAPMLEKGLRLEEAEYGADHPNTLRARHNVIMVTTRSGDFERALPLSKSNLDTMRRTLGDKHPNTIAAIGVHADLLRELKQYEESERLFDLSLELMRTHLPTRHYVLGICLTKYSELLWAQERFEEAERNLVLGYEILVEQVGDKNRHAMRALQRLIELMEDTDQPERAAEYRKLVAGGAS